MNGKGTDKRYASAKKVDQLEVEVENLQSALEAQAEIVSGLREQILPQPVEARFAPGQSPAARHLRGVEI